MVIGNKILRKKEIFESSMDWARKELSVAEDGTVFVSDKYTIARGRQGREWKIFPGQLSITFILKNISVPEKLNYLNMAISIAVVGTLSKYNVKIKWPNDFIIENKKVGGMLIEAIWRDNSLLGVIIGISINCNNTIVGDSLFKIATSIFDITGNKIDIPSLQQHLIESLNKWYNKFLLQESSEIFSAWKNLQVCLGKNISVHTKEGDSVKGTVSDIDSDGNIYIIDTEKKLVSVAFHSVENISIK